MCIRDRLDTLFTSFLPENRFIFFWDSSFWNSSFGSPLLIVGNNLSWSSLLWNYVNFTLVLEREVSVILSQLSLLFVSPWLGYFLRRLSVPFLGVSPAIAQSRSAGSGRSFLWQCGLSPASGVRGSLSLTNSGNALFIIFSFPLLHSLHYLLCCSL